jgi:hypothetical protein
MQRLAAEYDFDAMQFRSERAREALSDITKLESAFVWAKTPQGASYWLAQETNGLTFEGRSTLCYMIAQSAELEFMSMFRRAA